MKLAIEIKDKEISELKKRNGILLRSLNTIHKYISDGEHIDKEWIKLVIEEEPHSMVIDAHVKMLSFCKNELGLTKAKLNKAVEALEFYSSLEFFTNEQGNVMELYNDGNWDYIGNKARQTLKEINNK